MKNYLLNEIIKKGDTLKNLDLEKLAEIEEKISKGIDLTKDQNIDDLFEDIEWLIEKLKFKWTK
ncbi:hypothetical protein D3C84_1173310 [compost metagenome]